MTKKHDILWLESVDSTNNEVSRLIENLDNLSVVSALSQSEGRGQRGNLWISNPGQNLTFSILLKFGTVDSVSKMMFAKNQILISAITAISVVDLLNQYSLKADIKWPNDIYVGEKKICGILIENSVRGNLLKHCIVGIGLNINQCNFDVTLPNPTSIAIESEQPGQLDIRVCLEEFMTIFKRNLCLLDRDRDILTIRKRYMSLLLMTPNLPLEEINRAWQI